MICFIYAEIIVMCVRNLPHIKQKLKENKMDTLNQGKEDKE